MKKTVPKFTNALIHSQSPYLLQHAHNPVDWMEWGPAAHEKAKKENKPLFVQTGYSSCHWCRVMEQESFEDEETAQYMNKHFVCVKVDREERPDLDQVWMHYVQATQGGGGWPLSVFLSPELNPIFGGTYFPKVPSYNRISFMQLLNRIHDLWQDKGPMLEENGRRVMEGLRKMNDDSVEEIVLRDLDIWNIGKDDQEEDQILQKATKEFLNLYDKDHGGFEGPSSPKFPRPSIYSFMFRMQFENKDLLKPLLFCIRSMAQRGLYDHLGGGFHRYCVDRLWHIPHFEKMLYDQPQLIHVLLDAYSASGDDFYADKVRETITYLMRDMRHKELGAFFSSEDADSLPTHESPKVKEGAFYVFTYQELKDNIPKDDFEIFTTVYNCEKEGNAMPSSDPHGEFKNQNHFIQVKPYKEIAEKLGVSVDRIKSAVQNAKFCLFSYRNKRPRPPLDDKIVTSWNGLLIGALARSGQVLRDDSMIQTAEQVVKFIKKTMWDGKTLKRCYRVKLADIDGFLSDYSYLISGLIDLYEATGEESHLIWAHELQERQNELFGDSKNGGFFETTGKDSSVLMRMKETYDGAEPSGNSVSALNLLRLSTILGLKPYKQLAFQTIQRSSYLKKAPQAVPAMLSALHQLMSNGRIFVLVSEDDKSKKEFLHWIHKTQCPNRVIIHGKGAYVAKMNDMAKGKTAQNGKTTLYDCDQYSCREIVTDYKKLEEW